MTLAFQPKVDLVTLQSNGFEALARRDDAQHGPVPPTVFIPPAEQTELITDLTRWALGRALAQMEEWRRLGTEIPLGVNISVRDLLDDGFPSFVMATLDAHALPHHR